MKVVFLDIDGVIATAGNSGSLRRGPESLDSNCVNQLNLLVKNAKCGVVISSSWRRIMSIQEIENIFREAGYSEIPFSSTPKVNKPDMCRGDEIQEWLDYYQDFEKEPIQFVILDDNSDMGPFKDKLVQTKITEGLTEEYRLLAEEMLR